MIARSKPFARRVELSRSALRSGRITRRTKVRAVNVARQSKAFRRAYGGAERAAWVRALPCIACGAGPSDNAHVRTGIATGGMGRKADAAAVVPLCRVHHDLLHRVGPASFESAYVLSLATEAARVDRLFRERGAAA